MEGATACPCPGPKGRETRGVQGPSQSRVHRVLWVELREGIKRRAGATTLYQGWSDVGAQVPLHGGILQPEPKEVQKGEGTGPRRGKVRQQPLGTNDQQQRQRRRQQRTASATAGDYVRCQRRRTAQMSVPAPPA